MYEDLKKLLQVYEDEKFEQKMRAQRITEMILTDPLEALVAEVIDISLPIPIQPRLREDIIVKLGKQLKELRG